MVIHGHEESKSRSLPPKKSIHYRPKQHSGEYPGITSMYDIGNQSIVTVPLLKVDETSSEVRP